MSGERIVPGMSTLCMHDMHNSCAGYLCNCECHFPPTMTSNRTVPSVDPTANTDSYRSISAEYREAHAGCRMSKNLKSQGKPVDMRCLACKHYDALTQKE